MKYDENSKDYVLWFKDTRGVFGDTTRGNIYIRGDSFPSMEDAKQNAAISVSASIFHHIWMAGLQDKGKIGNKQFAQFKEDADSGKPLTESTFKEEMGKFKCWSIIGTVIGVVGIASR